LEYYFLNKFQQTLFIARSNDSADTYLTQHSGAIKVVTLSSLLSSEEFTQSVAMDAFVAKMLLHRAIQTLKLDHFDYLCKAEASINEVYMHILTCKRNCIGLDVFGYETQKHTELQQIWNAYEELKNSFGFKDSADVMIEAVESLQHTDYFTQFSKVVLDVFEEEGIRFYANVLEHKALEIIRAMPHVEVLTPQISDLKSIETYTPQQSYFDEALFAIKAARKLMVDGVQDGDIAIVTGNLSRYRRILESNAFEYGMKLRFSSGIPILQSSLFAKFLKAKTFDKFKEDVSFRITQDYQRGLIDESKLEEVKLHFTQIKSLHHRTLIIIETAKKLFDEVLEYKKIILSLAEEAFIPPLKDQEGIWVSEPNQIPNHRFKHIIFIGTDLSQFPPKMRSNFLATPEQRERYLGVDNSYRLSQYYFSQMLKNSESLHISTAMQEGKKKLFISPIITNLPHKSFTDYECASVREVLHSKCRYKQDELFETYIEAALSPSRTLYDGLSQDFTYESGVLSASSLNEYAKCPLRYQLTFHYKAEALAVERDDDELEASDIGTIFHSIAEQFAQDVKANTIALGALPTDNIKEHLHAIATRKHQEYIQQKIIDEGKIPTVFHEIVLHDLTKGLFEEHHEKGLLVRFLEYVYQNGRLEDFEQSEHRFMLDSDFCITTEKDKAIIKGFIDRIDRNHTHQTVTIIDYKTGKYAKEKEMKLIEGMNNYQQFQLPLYLLYASHAYDDYTINSHLLSMRCEQGTKEYAHISTSTENGLCFDEAYAQGLKEKILSFKQAIESGEFAMTPSEENCSYCPYEKICHKEIFAHKVVKDEMIGDENE